MRNMKRIFLIFASLAAVVSCLDNPTYSSSYTAVATFEYDDKVFDSDSLYFDKEYSKTGFVWDYLAFHHKVDEGSSEFKGGFLLSRLAVPESGTEGLSNNEYRVNVKASENLPNKYAVFHVTDAMPEKHFSFVFDSSGEIKGTCTMQSVYVNNTVAVTDAVKASFEDGDVMTLKAVGYLAGTKTGDAEIDLVEYTSVKDSIVSAWTAFDLSKLGSVDRIDFDVVVPEGKDIPKTVCMDNMIAAIALQAE